MSIRPPSPLPDLAHIADLVHSEFDDSTEAILAALIRDDVLEAGIWVPPEPGTDVHEALIGWLAPSEIDLIGVSTFDDEGRLTTFIDRRGRLATVDGHGDTPVPTPLLTADLLSRTVGLPTPDPPVSVAGWLDLRWLDVLPEAVFDADRPLRLDDLLELHPLHRSGVDSPAELRSIVETVARTGSWADVRRRWLGRPDAPAPPPGGMEIAACDWFDDGSFCRYHLSRLAPPGQILADLQMLLPSSLIEVIGAGFTGSGPPR